jgi:hypothetical protein
MRFPVISTCRSLNVDRPQGQGRSESHICMCLQLLMQPLDIYLPNVFVTLSELCALFFARNQEEADKRKETQRSQCQYPFITKTEEKKTGSESSNR